jgi:hypothetical protein
MNVTYRRSMLSAASLLVCALPAFAQTAEPSAHWEGLIHVPEHELNISVDLAKGRAGAWIGSMTILHSTTVDVPLDTVTIADGHVRFTARLPGETVFEGRLSTDARALAGTASNAMGGVPFELTRVSDADVKIPPSSSPLLAAFEGTWEGTLESNGQARRVRVKLSAASDGTATAVLVSVDKGNLEIPVTTVTLHDTELELDARVISGIYRGTLGADDTITGEWTEGAQRFPLTLKHVS